jgi:hypothetical protein
MKGFVGRNFINPQAVFVFLNYYGKKMEQELFDIDDATVVIRNKIYGQM